MRASKLVLSLALTATCASGNMLEELYNQALDYDAEFSAARAQFMAASQAAPQLRATMLPQINASATAQRSRDKITESLFPQQIGSSTSDSYSASLSLSQPLFDWAGFARLRQMDERQAQAEAGLASAQQQLILRTVSAYFDLLAAEDSLRFAQAEKEAIGQQLRQAKSRFEVGLSAITDVQEAQARYDASRAQEIAAASTLRSARESLGVITGSRPDKPVALRAPLKTNPPDPAMPEAWIEQAMSNNLDLKQAELAARIAREQVREQSSTYLPRLSLFARQNYQDATDTPQQSKSESSVIGLQLDLPLFAGGGNHARVQEKRYLFDKADADWLRSQREVAKLARDAYDGVVTGEVQVEALHQAVESSKVALRAIEAGFKVGSRTSVDVLNAQRELYRAERDLSRSRFDYLLSVLRLKQAVGALSEDDLREVDALLADSAS